MKQSKFVAIPCIWFKAREKLQLEKKNDFNELKPMECQASQLFLHESVFVILPLEFPSDFVLSFQTCSWMVAVMLPCWSWQENILLLIWKFGSEMWKQKQCTGK